MSGNTAAHNAAMGAHLECLNCLLKHDANLEIINKNGETPLDIARRFGHPVAFYKAGKQKMTFHSIWCF